MNRVNLSRKVGETIRITAPGGREALITIKSINNGVLQVCVEAQPEIVVSRLPEIACESCEYDLLDNDDREELRQYFK